MSFCFMISGKYYKLVNINKNMAKVNRFIFWAPRTLAIIFILFLAIFSSDIFEGNYGFFGTILGLFMHNIPSLVLLVILIISWKHDLAGAITFISLGAVCVIGIIFVMLYVPEGSRFNPILIIGSIVFLFIGILFLIGWKQKKKPDKHKRLLIKK